MQQRNRIIAASKFAYFTNMHMKLSKKKYMVQRHDKVTRWAKQE